MREAKTSINIAGFKRPGFMSEQSSCQSTPLVTSIDAAWERVVILEPLTAPLDGRAFGRVLVSQP